MSETFITYQITISEEELEIVEAIVDNLDKYTVNALAIEDAIIKGILEQIVTPNKE
jgi:hypothetical protein